MLRIVLVKFTIIGHPFSNFQCYSDIFNYFICSLRQTKFLNSRVAGLMHPCYTLWFKLGEGHVNFTLVMLHKKISFIYFLTALRSHVRVWNLSILLNNIQTTWEERI